MKSLRNPNRNPTHPGAVLREDVLPELGITQATLASHLGISRLTVSDLLHEKRSLTTEMAVRNSWWPYLNMRNASDLKVIGQ